MKAWLLPIAIGLFFGFCIGPPRVVHAQGNGAFGVTGQQAVTASAVAIAFTSPLPVICIKGHPSNASPALVYIGSTSSVTTSTGYPLAADDSVCVSALKPIYVIASGTGSNVAWFTTTN